MRVARLAPLPVGTLFWTGARPMLTVVVKATFDIDGRGRATLADAQIPLAEDGPAGATTLRDACDFVPHKGAVDVLVVGHAKSAAPAPHIRVRVAVPPVIDRRCLAMTGAPSERAPLAPPFLMTDGGEVTTLGPSTLVRDVRRSPELGADFDFGRFNVAPAAQRAARLDAGATLVLEGLLGDGRPCHVPLPNLVPTVYFALPPSPWQSLRMFCDTVWIDADASQLTLTWRGLRALASRDPDAFLVLAMGEGRSRSAAELESHLTSASWIDSQPGASPSFAPSPSTERRPHVPAAASATLNLEDLAAVAEALPFLRDTAPVPPPSAAEVGDELEGDEDDDGPPTPAAGMTLGGSMGLGAALGAVALTGQTSPEEVTPFSRTSSSSLPAPRPSAPVPGASERPRPAPRPSAPAPPLPRPSGPGRFSRPQSPPAQGPTGEPPVTLPKSSVEEAPGSVTAVNIPIPGDETLDIEDEDTAHPDLPFKNPGSGAPLAELPPHLLRAIERMGQRGGTMAFDDDAESDRALPFEGDSTLNLPQETVALPAHGPPEPSLPPGLGPLPATASGPSYPLPPVPAPRVPAPPLPAAAPVPEPAISDTAPSPPSEPPLAIGVYAAIKIAALDHGSLEARHLAQHDLDEAAWRLADRRMTVALAHDDGSLASELAAAMKAARAATHEPADELDVEGYVAIRAEIEEAADPQNAMFQLGLGQTEWERMRRDWTRRALADRELARQIRIQLAQARQALRKQ
jgi:Uncharacterized protein conserved in bacteria (DUF2169)